MHKQQEIVMLSVVHPPIFEAFLLLPCLTNKVVALICLADSSVWFWE